MTAASPSQQHVDEQGVWMRRQFTTRLSAGDDVIFTVPVGSRIHDAYIDVDTAGTDAGTYTGAVELANNGGDVILIAAADLTSAAISPIESAAVQHHQATALTAGDLTTDVKLTVVATPATVGASVEVGIFVTREPTSAL